MTFLRDISHRWGALELAPVIQAALRVQPEAKGLGTGTCTFEDIANKIASLTLKDFQAREVQPKQLERAELAGALYSSFAALISKSFSGDSLVQDEYQVIALARRFAQSELDADEPSEQRGFAEQVIALAQKWDERNKLERRASSNMLRR